MTAAGLRYIRQAEWSFKIICLLPLVLDNMQFTTRRKVPAQKNFVLALSRKNLADYLQVISLPFLRCKKGRIIKMLYAVPQDIFQHFLQTAEENPS